MPNQSSPPSLGTGINGIYYVNNNLPQFVNSTGSSPIAIGTVAEIIGFNGTVLINHNANFVITPNISGNVSGFVNVIRSSDGSMGTFGFIKNSTVGFFATTATYSNSTNFGVAFNPTNLAVFNGSNSTNYTFSFSGFYYPTV